MSKLEFQISKALQDVVRKNELIKEVYYDERGNFYFNKHEVVVHTSNKKHESTGSKKVTCVPGCKQGILKVQVGDSFQNKKVIVEATEVYAVVSRKDILDAQAVPEKLSEKEEIRLAQQLLALLTTAPDSLIDMIQKAKAVKA